MRQNMETGKPTCIVSALKFVETFLPLEKKENTQLISPFSTNFLFQVEQSSLILTNRMRTKHELKILYQSQTENIGRTHSILIVCSNRACTIFWPHFICTWNASPKSSKCDSDLWLIYFAFSYVANKTNSRQKYKLDFYEYWIQASMEQRTTFFSHFFSLGKRMRALYTQSSVL